MSEKRNSKKAESRRKEKITCWDFFQCNEKECPAYKKADLRCWLFPGTHCRDEIQGKFLHVCPVGGEKS